MNPAALEPALPVVPFPEDLGDFGPEAWPHKAPAPPPRPRRKVVRVRPRRG